MTDLIDGHCRYYTDIDCEKVCIHWRRVENGRDAKQWDFLCRLTACISSQANQNLLPALFYGVHPTSLHKHRASDDKRKLNSGVTQVKNANWRSMRNTTLQNLETLKIRGLGVLWTLFALVFLKMRKQLKIILENPGSVIRLWTGMLVDYKCVCAFEKNRYDRHGASNVVILSWCEAYQSDSLIYQRAARMTITFHSILTVSRHYSVSCKEEIKLVLEENDRTYIPLVR